MTCYYYYLLEDKGQSVNYVIPFLTKAFTPPLPQMSPPQMSPISDSFH